VLYRFDCAQVLLHDGEPVGLMKLAISPDTWELLQLQLSPRLQGRGIGRALLDELLADPDAAGVDVTLSLLKANPAKRLYERLGFVQVGAYAFEFHMRRPAAG
jgi:ribosomal protein S18 acetylase RimI-like enzyme